MIGGKQVIVGTVFLAAFASAVILKRDPFIRLIPADVLRDYNNGCFASTQCKVFKPNETWPLSPYCGRARCVALKTEDKKIRLAEEVSDCGPLVDLEKTPGCQILKEDFDPKAEFPDCCPKYDCEEGIEVVYVTAKAKEEKAKEADAPSGNAPITGEKTSDS